MWGFFTAALRTVRGMDDYDSVLDALDFPSDYEEPLRELDDAGFPSGESAFGFWAQGFHSLEAALTAAGWDGRATLLPVLSPLQAQAQYALTDLGAPQIAVDGARELTPDQFLRPYGVTLPHSLVYYATHSAGEAAAAVLVGVTRSGQQWAWLNVDGEDPLLVDLTQDDLPTNIATISHLRQVADWVLLTMGEDLPEPSLGLADLVIHTSLAGALDAAESSPATSPDLESRQAGHALSVVTDFRRRLLLTTSLLLHTASHTGTAEPFDTLVNSLELGELEGQSPTGATAEALSDPRVLEVIDEGLDMLRHIGWGGVDADGFAELVGAPEGMAEWVGANGLARLIQLDVLPLNEAVLRAANWAGDNVDFLISDLQDLGIDITRA